jgi:hypothetical protein
MPLYKYSFHSLLTIVIHILALFITIADSVSNYTTRLNVQSIRKPGPVTWDSSWIGGDSGPRSCWRYWEELYFNFNVLFFYKIYQNNIYFYFLKFIFNNNIYKIIQNRKNQL